MVAANQRVVREVLRTSAPVALAGEQKAVRSHVEGLTRELADFKIETTTALDGHRTRMMSWREDIDALLDTVEDTLDRTERKRRSSAASASKLERAAAANGGEQEPDGDLTSQSGLRARARAMGIDVL